MSSSAIGAPDGASLPVTAAFNVPFPNCISSEGTDKILPALFKALETIGPAVKESENPHLRSKYADLASNMDAAKPVLHEHKIRILQPPTVDGQLVSVATIFLHESGQWIATTLNMTCISTDPQAIGKTITYCRRYSMNGFLGMIAEDDDGNSGSGVNGPQQTGARAARVPNKPGPVLAAQGAPEQCDECGNVIEPTKVKTKDGEATYSVADLIAKSHQKFNRKMCAKCQVVVAKKMRASAAAPIGVPAEGAAPAPSTASAA
jgi:hypothetical protein